MIPVAPTAFPEPAPVAEHPRGEKASKSKPGEAREFGEILDRQTEQEPAEEHGVAVNPPVVASETEEVVAVVPPDEEEPVIEEAEDEPPIDVAVLSSQLALWPFAPRPVEPAPVLPVADLAEPLTAAASAPQDETPAAPALTSVAADASETPTNLPEAPVEAPTERTVPAAEVSPSPVPAPEIPEKPAAPTIAEQISQPVVGPNSQGETAFRAVTAVLPKDRAAITGIPVAKQQRAMTDRENSSTPAPATAGFAGASVPVNSTAVVAPTAPAAGQKFQDQPRQDAEQQPDSMPLPAVTAAFTPEAAKPQTASAAPESSTPVRASETAQIIERVERTVEHMRTLGGQRMEVRLPLQEGGEVVVKLRVDAGLVKAVFRTESNELRNALEAGWNQFSSQSPERAMKIGQAVFESPASQNGMGGFQQAPDQRSRQQAFAEAESQLNPPPFSAVNKPARAAHSAPAAAVRTVSATGLQLYA